MAHLQHYYHFGGAFHDAYSFRAMLAPPRYPRPVSAALSVASTLSQLPSVAARGVANLCRSLLGWPSSKGGVGARGAVGELVVGPKLA